MQIIVSNKIIINDYTFELLKWCNDNLVIENPEYYKKQQLGKWTGDTPKEIVLYERHGNNIYLPFGVWNKEFYNKWKTKCTAISSDIKPIKAFNYDSHINLYPYQEKAVNEAITKRNGVIVMPCGSGKTQTALEIIARIGGKALWLTHTQDLLNQSMKRAKSVLAVPRETYGTITGGKVDVGSGITFATVQTMSKIDLTELKYEFDVIVVDECHKAIGSPTKVMQFYKVLSALSCRHKFGVTATPRRTDGLEKSMFALLGNIICEIPKSEIADKTCEVRVEFVQTGYTPDYDKILMADGTIDYSAVIDDLTHNEQRFKIVLDTIEKLPINSPTLVLGNRVEYLQRLSREYCGRSNCLSGMGQSKAAKQERKIALTALNDGDIDVLFATYQLAKEGLDVPNLRYVVFATPEKNEITVTQSAGRVGRCADGKEFGTVIDFIDDFSMYKTWYGTRKRYYRKLGYIFDEE